MVGFGKEKWKERERGGTGVADDVDVEALDGAVADDNDDVVNPSRT